MTANSQAPDMAEFRLYEAETSIEAVAARHALNVDEVIDFSLNVNPFGPPLAAVEAARAVMAQSNLYPDLRFAALRGALAAHHGVDKDSFFFGSGLDDVIKLLIHAWTNAGDNVLIHLPTFPRYELEARLRGCNIVSVEGEAPEKIDIAAMCDRLGRSDIALTFLCSPNNPTGEKVSNSTISDLCRFAGLALVVVDEALLDPAEPGAVPLLSTHANLVILRTFSKYYGLAGARVGYAIAPPELVRKADVGRPPFNVALASVEAARVALKDVAFLDSSRATFSAEYAWFVNAIADINGLRVRGNNANMVLLDIDMDPEVASNRLAAQGVVVADARAFRGMERYQSLRVSLRGRADNEKLLTALRNVLNGSVKDHHDAA